MEKELKQPQMPILTFGWICPKCGRVFNPFNLECSYCNANIEEEKNEVKKVTETLKKEFEEYLKTLEGESNEDIGKTITN